MNNSAATRRISKIAIEYNGDDKGMAQAVESNYLLSETPEDQFFEMKTVADRNPNVKKWALTGYISPPEENTEQLSDADLTKIAVEALYKVGVTSKNQFRLDIHNSSKHKHIHFIVNRIDVNGKCTVDAHNIGKRFGAAVRQLCVENNLKTDIEIGLQKKKKMLSSLKESLTSSSNFNALVDSMKLRGYIVQLSQNEKIGISGMRIILETDVNNQTERQYKPGYKLSEITSKLKIAEIKELFEMKKAVTEARVSAKNWIDLKENLNAKGFSMKMKFDGEIQKKVEDIYVKKTEEFGSVSAQNGLFNNKYNGFSLSATIDDFENLKVQLQNTNNLTTYTDSGNMFKSELVVDLLHSAGETLQNILRPNYTASPDDELLKKKRKNKR